MIEVCHDLIPIYPITQWKVWLIQRLGNRSITQSSDEPEMDVTHPSLYPYHDRGLS
ncbi:MAG: hypothetical protein QXY37_04350 [Metallosphaera sp.]